LPLLLFVPCEITFIQPVLKIGNPDVNFTLAFFPLRFAFERVLELIPADFGLALFVELPGGASSRAGS
jgi:hypothetical protein